MWLWNLPVVSNYGSDGVFETKSVLLDIILIFLVICVNLSLVLFNYELMALRHFPPTRLRHRIRYWIKLLWSGFFLSVTLHFIKDHGLVDFYGTRGQLIKNSLSIKEDARGWNHGKHNLSMKNRIWFVTTTEYSLEQGALLTKTGQSLFPVRDFVVWVIVKHESIQEKSNDKFCNETTQLLLTTVKRFGIPFVVLKSNGVFVAELEEKDQAWIYDAADSHTAGIQNGLVWIMSNVQNGIILMSHQHFTFDYHLFFEVAATKEISVWPIGLHHTNNFNYKFLLSPLVGDNQEVIGFISGNNVEMNTMQVEQGGFAVNIEYLRTLLKNDLWKLTYDDYFFNFVGVPMSKIAPIANFSSKIYAWRTRAFLHHWPRFKSVSIGEKQQNSNMEIILHKTYNYKYDDIVSVKKEKHVKEEEEMDHKNN